MTSLRLVLVGKMGAGKSSAGNTILRKNEFKAGFSFISVTTECQRGEGKVNGRTVTVVDTPGVTELKVSKEDAESRVVESFSMCDPGPHAFLLVINLSSFTPEEKQAAEVIQEVFGEAAFEHTMLLFTHGDQLEDPNDLEDLVMDCEELTYLLDKVNWRYHVFDNKRNDRTQVIELLKKIDLMVDEQEGHYTSELFQVAIEKRKERQEKERMRREMEELRQEWNEKPELRILLIGNTTASNRIASKMILGERLQYEYPERCLKINGSVCGRRVSVVETPGLSSDCRRKPNEIMHEILSCISLASPGPHAFVIVERSREISAKRKGILELIKDAFGDPALKYVILLAIESSANPVHSFDNDSHSAEHSCLLEHNGSEAPLKQEHLPTHTFQDPIRSRQVTSLLQEIDRMVERNGGSSFTSEMYSVAEKSIIEAQNEILEERKLEISKERRDVKWGGKAGFENSLEWKKEMIKARELAKIVNLFKSFCVIAAIAAVVGGGGAAVGAVVGYVLGAAIGAVAGGPAGAVAGANAGAVAGAKTGASIGSAVGAVAGVVVGAAYRYRLRKACNIQ